MMNGRCAFTSSGTAIGANISSKAVRNAPFTSQALQTMLERLGVNIRGQTLRTGNVAAVMVTAVLPPFARTGQTIDPTVSSLGNAKSLRGGTLIATPLRGADGQVYAIAQGNLIVGGAGATPAQGVSGNTTVLVTGETGTGKEVIARAIEKEVNSPAAPAPKAVRLPLVRMKAGRKLNLEGLDFDDLLA